MLWSHLRVTHDFYISSVDICAMERIDALKADEGIVTESPVNHMNSHDTSKLVDQENNTAMSSNGNATQSLYYV